MKSAATDRYWQGLESSRLEWDRKGAAVVARLFATDRDDVVAAFKKSGKAAALKVIEDSRPLWKQVITAYKLEVLKFYGKREFGKMTYTLSGKKSVKAAGTEFSENTNRAVDWITGSGTKKIKWINDYTRDEINGIISTGADKGQVVDEVAANIHDMFTAWADTGTPTVARAMLIARTEGTGAFGFAHQEGARQAAEMLGVEGVTKTWITAADSRVRESHAAMGGETVPIDEPYSNGLMYPGDQSEADAAEVVNCRCVESHDVK